MWTRLAGGWTCGYLILLWPGAGIWFDCFLGALAFFLTLPPGACGESEAMCSEVSYLSTVLENLNIVYKF
jgi:hypothetical protein